MNAGEVNDAVLTFLYERQSIYFPLPTIRRGVERATREAVTDAEVATAVSYLTQLDMVEGVKDAVTLEVAHRISAKGIQKKAFGSP